MNVLAPHKVWLDLGVAPGTSGFLPRHDETAQAMSALLRALPNAAPSGWQVAPLQIDQAMAGDTVVLAGGFARQHPPRQADIAHALAAQGVRVVLVVHDIARLNRPEWFAPQEQAAFRLWLDDILKVASLVLVPSDATGRDIGGYLHQGGLGSVPVRRVPMGDGVLDAAPAGQISISRPFALVPTTIDTRRNQDVLVEGWRRLAARMPDRARPLSTPLPLLVLAGRLGEMSGDLALRLGRVRDWNVALCPAEDDATLAAMYRDCEFVIVPSLQAGWGAHVTQSLVLGRPVFAAKAGALPEAGGRLARYFDPMDPADLARAVERVLLDPPDLARWQGEIARDYQRQSWNDAAQGWLAALA